ncbi:MAG: hypothetical protein ACREA2_02620 [Blastocatellia bacterium]
MLARDAPKSTPLTVIESAPAAVQVEQIGTPPSPVSAPNPAPIGTGTAKPARAAKPRSKKSARPPSVAGYTWRKDGAGWQLRKSVYESDGTGTTKRKRPYVAHLSKSAFGELKRWHKGAALERAIAAWIEEHDR